MEQLPILVLAQSNLQIKKLLLLLVTTNIFFLSLKNYKILKEMTYLKLIIHIRFIFIFIKPVAFIFFIYFYI